MNFTSFQPQSPIAGGIDSIFHFSGFQPDHYVERVVPTGHVHLLFELDGYPRHVYDNDTLKPSLTLDRVWISGMQTRYLTISAHDESEMFVVRFRPEGAHAFLHVDMHHLNEKVISAENILGTDVLELREKMLLASTPRGRFDLADQWLRGRFLHDKQPSDTLVAVLRRLETEPAANLRDIVEQYPHTHQHLIDQFKKRIGLTPKVYQRIMRFNSILRMIQNEDRITWADIAYSCGYADQSHFIKEFKFFSGFNPREFIESGHHEQEPNFFPID